MVLFLYFMYAIYTKSKGYG